MNHDGYKSRKFWLTMFVLSIITAFGLAVAKAAIDATVLGIIVNGVVWSLGIYCGVNLTEKVGPTVVKAIKDKIFPDDTSGDKEQP